MDLIALGVPRWYTTSGIAIELLFAFVALAIALFSWKVHKFMKKRQTGLFTLGFFLISFAYFIQAALNFFIVRGIMSHTVLSAMRAPPEIVTSFQLSIIAVSLHVLFVIAGLALLAYVTLKERNPQVYALLISVSILGLLFTKYLILTFYLMSSIYYLFITLQHYKRHTQRHTLTSFFIYFGFALLFIGTFQLAISMILGIFYILGHLTLLIGYLLLLASLLRVTR